MPSKCLQSRNAFIVELHSSHLMEATLDLDLCRARSIYNLECSFTSSL